MKAELPPDEAERLAALRQYGILDTSPERAFDDITRLAAQICQTPIALISLVDEARQWFKSRLGLDARETPRDLAFCAHALLNPGELLEVRDARTDARFADNPLVTSGPGIRFYAGAPLVDGDGYPLGTLCVIDRAPRELSEEQRDALRVLSRHVVTQLELRRRARELEVEAAERRRAEEQARRKQAMLEAIREVQAGFIASGDPRATFGALLRFFLEHTESEYGFLGEVLRGPDGAPYVKTHAITNIAWSEPLRRFYAEYEPGGLEFHNLRTLFGAVLRTEQPVIANDAGAHPERGGLPPGHPPLRAFLGLPLFHAGQLVGILGAANRPGGYDEALARQMEPLLATCAGLIAGWRVERRRQSAEHALRESEERFRELAETIDDVFWVADARDRRLLYVSPAYEKIWQRSRQSLVEAPASWLATVHPEDRERVLATRRRPVEDGCDMEYRIVLPSGLTRWIRDRVFPVRGAAGELERLVGVAKDITARRRAEDDLRATNERYARQEAALLALTRACAMGQTDIASLTREVARVAAVTLEVERVSVWRLARDRQAIVCQTLFERATRAHSSGHVLRSAEYPQYFRALIEADIIVAHDAHLHESTADFSDSYLKPLGITSMLDAPIHVAGTVAGVFCCEHVGPGRRWTSDEQTFVVALANLVSLLLAQEERQQVELQLRQSQKMEAVGLLAGGVAHDFNNILQAMLIQIDLVGIEPGLGADARDSVEQLRLSARRAADLTRQLLMFSRRQVMQPRQLDLNEVVTDVTRMLQRIIGEDVRLQLDLHPAPLPTRADVGMLEQVLMNLAVNARDAMPAGGQITLATTPALVDEQLARLHPDAAPGRYVCLRVDDTGVGIPPDVLPRIFEPFFTTKPPGKGTGLGLATVFGIVKQHQGWLTVCSDPGRGARFEVFLPAAVAAARPEPPRPTLAGARGGHETVLVVEDDRAVLLMIRAILRRHGYRVIEALHGVDALAQWERCRDQVSLLLTDLVMPAGIGGHELARRLVADRPDLKVIYMSGYSAELAGRELRLGRRETFLQKPFPPELLLETVRRCLDGRPAADGS